MYKVTMAVAISDDVL